MGLITYTPDYPPKVGCQGLQHASFAKATEAEGFAKIARYFIHCGWYHDPAKAQKLCTPAFIHSVTLTATAEASAKAA